MLFFLMIETPQKMLSLIGLKNKEARIYLLCLAAGQGLYVHEIVKKTKYSRSSIDLMLQRLLRQNYMHKTKVESRYKYFAESPKNILAALQKTTALFAEAVPFLGKLTLQESNIDIRFFDGAEGVRKVYNDILLQFKMSDAKDKTLYSFSSGSHALKTFPAMQKSFIEKRVKLGIPYRAIAPDGSRAVKEWSNDAKALRQVKYVDDSLFEFLISVEIYLDNVMICTSAKPVGGIIIRNAAIARSLRALFNLVWHSIP
jgi:predicted transcriptional regulator